MPKNCKIVKTYIFQFTFWIYSIEAQRGECTYSEHKSCLFARIDPNVHKRKPLVVCVTQNLLLVFVGGHIFWAHHLDRDQMKKDGFFLTQRKICPKMNENLALSEMA